MTDMTAPPRLAGGAATKDPAARLLAQVEPPALDPFHRTRLLAKLREAAPREAPALVRPRVFAAGVAVAVLAAFVLSRPMPLPEAPMTPEVTVAATDAPVPVDTAVLRPQPATRWSVDRRPHATVVRLHVGRIVAEVRPPGAGRAFVMQTGQARLTVVGTLFSVETDGRSTQLRVDRGIVRVDDGSGGRLVRAGESWSSDAAPAPAVEEPARPEPSRPTLRGAARRATADASLHDEADLVAAARRDLVDDRNPDAALKDLDRHAARHPAGSLMREALLLRLSAQLESSRRADAVVTARRFLELFPSDPRAGDVRRRLDELCAAPGADCP